MSTTKPITPKQQRFVAEYLKDLNGTQAAIRAGYSAKTANEQAARLLANVSVQAAIEKAQTKRTERLQIDADYVLNRLVEIDQMDALDILNDDMSLKAVSQWPKVWRQYLSGFEVAEINEGRGDEREMVGVLKKIKWPDKTKNLELIGKHVNVNAFREQVDVTVNVSLADRMAKARERTSKS